MNCVKKSSYTSTKHAKNLETHTKQDWDWIFPESEKKLAEDGFDPSTSGLWAQHAPTAPLCWHCIKGSIRSLVHVQLTHATHMLVIP